LAERVERLRATGQFSHVGRRQWRIKNALRKHTHSRFGEQAGAEIWAAAKPKEKTKIVAIDAARGDILCLTTLDLAGGGALEGKKKERRSNG
jgi:hypothetical protein